MLGNTAQNRRVIVDWNKLCGLAAAEVEGVLAALPGPLRVRAVSVPVLFERHPSAEWQADGIEADTLGLFSGPDFVEENSALLPPQIILFLENIWDYAEGHEIGFRAEVRTTFLHELGHYLGLDETDLIRRGLE